MTDLSKKKISYQKEINTLIEQLDGTPVLDDNYETILNRLERLQKLESQQNGHKNITADGVMMVAANVLGIVSILGYEQTRVLTTKALSFVSKTKL